MASHSQHPANRFAQSPEYLTDHSHQADSHHSANDIEPTLSSDSNIDSNDAVDNNADNMNEPLCVHVERVVRQYFAMLGDETPTELYELILKEMERPLLSIVLEKTRGNQTKAAQILGLNRGTLRTKLKTYDLM